MACYILKKIRYHQNKKDIWYNGSFNGPIYVSGDCSSVYSNMLPCPHISERVFVSAYPLHECVYACIDPYMCVYECVYTLPGRRERGTELRYTYKCV